MPTFRVSVGIALLALAPGVAGCARDCERVGLSDDARCRVAGWPDRAVVVHTPAGWDGSSPLPLVVARHGHGGSGAGFDRSTCADGDEGSENCLNAVADDEGFAVAYPDGTANGLGLSRSWNGGGGGDGFRCVGDPACADGVDDIAYDDDLFALLTALLPVDTTRVYATGMSNGAAMSHRLGCERAERYAAVVAVSGGNEAAAFPGCAPALPVPLLHIHGSADPCWEWDGTVGDICSGQLPGRFISVDESMEAWAGFNGCTGGPDTAPLDDAADDGLTSTRATWSGCAADTALIRVEGGGHSWPGGEAYLSERLIGPVTMDFSASREAWAFLEGHRR